MLGFLIFLQLLVFLYYVVVNVYYSISCSVALLDIHGQLAVASRQHIRNLVTGVYYRPISILVPAYKKRRPSSRASGSAWRSGTRNSSWWW